ncbi:hypothetical protein QBC43DRAFT_290693 [Cladorrhinum sp. PSN259]|nr:hypothetical protein QBC43DRAFT_290693 [Cladorrhinum sp. PSN259]
MAAENNDPDQGALTPEEIECQRQEMMMELGTHRVNELAMDDRPANGDRRRPDDDRNFYDRRPRRNENRHRNRGDDLITAAGDMGSVWRVAMENGIFDDDDAAGVKDLDDLGGARLYDAANRKSAHPDQSRSSQQSMYYQAQTATSKQCPIDYSRNARISSSHCPDQRPAHHGAPKTQETVNKTRRLIMGLVKDMNRGPVMKPRVAGRVAIKALNSNAPIAMNKKADKEVRRPGRAVAAPAALAPQYLATASLANDSSAFAANDAFPEPDNTVVKVHVQFRPPSQPSHMPSTVYLSSGDPPAFGFFTVVVYGAKFCQWAIAAYDDCLNGEDLELICLFNDGIGYSLVFRLQEVLEHFYKTLRELKAKMSVAQKPIAGNPQASTAAPVEKQAQVQRPAPFKESSQSSTTVVAMLPATEQPSTTGSVAEFGSRAIVSTSSDLLTSDCEGRHSQDFSTPVVLTPKPKHELINLESDDVSVAPSCAQSEASELLSTLEPYDFASKRTCEDETESFVKRIRGMAKTFLGVFWGGGAAGKTKVEIAETIRGIREGIIEHFKEDETLTLERREAIEPALLSVFEEVLGNTPNQTPSARKFSINLPAPAQARASAQPAPTVRSPTASASGESVGNSRAQYNVDDLVSIRPNAAAVTIEWERLGCMPKPGERIAHLRTEAVPRSQPVAGWEPHRLASSADGMDWVLSGEHRAIDSAVPDVPATTLNVTKKSPLDTPARAPAHKAPQQSAQTGKSGSSQDRKEQTVVPSKPDVGLQKSRWAPPSLEIQQANAFTGLRYEKRWKKGSYMYDLAQLDPNVELTVGAEAIMDLFYPPPEAENTIAPFAMSAQPTFRFESQPVLADSTSTGNADHVEHLRRGIERMTINPQRGTSVASNPRVSEEAPLLSQPVQQQQQGGEPERAPEANQTNLPGREISKPFRGLGASRHARGDGPSTSGNFDFVRPKSDHN